MDHQPTEKIQGRPVARTKGPWFTPSRMIGYSLLGLCVAFVVAVIYPIFLSAKQASLSSQNLSHVKELSVAMSMYQEEYDHFLTPTSDWNARLLPYNGWKNSLNDEFLPKDGERRGIGLNPGVAAKDSSKFESPSETIVFGVTRYPGEDALVTALTTQLDFRCMIGFADGFAKRVAPNSLRPSQWTPVIVKDYEKE